MQGRRRRWELRGGLDGASQRLGTMAKWVRGWPEELVAEWIEEWSMAIYSIILKWYLFNPIIVPIILNILYRTIFMLIQFI